jgi:hypothetical protein
MLIESESAHPPSNGEVSQGEAYIRINRERESVHTCQAKRRGLKGCGIYTYVHIYTDRERESESVHTCQAKRRGLKGCGYAAGRFQRYFAPLSLCPHNYCKSIIDFNNYFKVIKT